MTATYSLQQVVASWDITSDMADPVRWLRKQIRSGRVRARKMGRSYRMTQADIDAALEAFASKPAVPPAHERARGRLSAASMRRRIA